MGCRAFLWAYCMIEYQGPVLAGGRWDGCRESGPHQYEGLHKTHRSVSHSKRQKAQINASLTLARQECALVRLVKQALLGLRLLLLLLLLCLMLLEGQQLLLLLLLSCKQLL